jgi:hypothetical protein
VRQDAGVERRTFVRSGAAARRARYEVGVRDLVFIVSVVGFFALAILFIRACEAIVGPGSELDTDGQR